MDKGKHGFKKQVHPLGYTDERDLAWMVKQNTARDKDGNPILDDEGYPKIYNVSSIYRNMGYKGKVVPQSFKERIRKVQGNE